MTNDIAMALRTPTQNAEEIKIKYGCALASLAGENETIKVPSVGERDDRDLSRQALAGRMSHVRGIIHPHPGGTSS